MLNPAPASGWSAALEADIVVPNEHEAAELGGAPAMLARGVSAVVTTLGSLGAAVVAAEGEWHQPAFCADVVDTTGAGDAFCGSLAARRQGDQCRRGSLRCRGRGAGDDSPRCRAGDALGDQIAALLATA